MLPSEKELDIGVMVVCLCRGHLAKRVMVDFSAEPSRGLPASSKAS
jgi:hypothetical protein